MNLHCLEGASYLDRLSKRPVSATDLSGWADVEIYKHAAWNAQNF